MKISIIAAVGKNLELGYKNKLIWNLKDDLKYFKKVTDGKTVVMGKNTFYSIGKPLPNRKNIVLSKSEDIKEDVETIKDYKKVLDLTDNEIFIIGGSEIYKIFLPFADNLYLTEIENSFPKADCYFPKFDKDLYYKTIIKENEENNIKYSYVLYRKIK